MVWLSLHPSFWEAARMVLQEYITDQYLPSSGSWGTKACARLCAHTHYLQDEGWNGMPSYSALMRWGCFRHSALSPVWCTWHVTSSLGGFLSGRWEFITIRKKPLCLLSTLSKCTKSLFLHQCCVSASGIWDWLTPLQNMTHIYKGLISKVDYHHTLILLEL